MYKLVALDCDGTLLNSKKEISGKTLRAIHRVRDKGVKVLLASARPYYRLQRIITMIGIDRPDQYSVCFNGALIINNTGTKKLYSHGFKSNEVAELLSLRKQFDTPIFLYTEHGIISNQDDAKYRQKNPDVIYDVVDIENLDYDETEIFKIAFVNSPERTKELRSALTMSIYEKYEVSSSVPQFVDFVSKGAKKSKALELIGRELNILPQEMIAFGDHDNDLSMFTLVGCSVAMGNATSEVKKQATLVTASNDEDGVALVLDKYI